MNQPTDRIYVLDHAHPSLHRHVLETEEDARTMHDQVPGTLRVFVEEPRWITATVLPSNSREVLVLFRPHGPTGVVARRTVGFYGSEGRWIAVSHDYRREYLDTDCVISWQDLPLAPEMNP